MPRHPLTMFRFVSSVTSSVSGWLRPMTILSSGPGGVSEYVAVSWMFHLPGLANESPGDPSHTRLRATATPAMDMTPKNKKTVVFFMSYSLFLAFCLAINNRFSILYPSFNHSTT